MKPAPIAFAGKIRAAQAPAPPRIAERAGQLSYPSTPEEIAHRLQGLQRTADAAVFVAELERGEIAGGIAGLGDPTGGADGRAGGRGLVVEERFRSQRVGEHLLARAEDWARENDCQAIGLRSNVIRGRAHAFYERHGYTHVKTQKAFRKQL